jgi:hypothetical protein
MQKGTKTCLADGLVQKYLEERDEIDWRRNLIFGGYGALGSNGDCNQGTTYAGAPNAVCGGSNNWGATEMEVWYPVP